MSRLNPRSGSKASSVYKRYPPTRDPSSFPCKFCCPLSSANLAWPLVDQILVYRLHVINFQCFELNSWLHALDTVQTGQRQNLHKDLNFRTHNFTNSLWLIKMWETYLLNMTMSIKKSMLRISWDAMKCYIIYIKILSMLARS